MATLESTPSFKALCRAFLCTVLLAATGCAAEVGSDAWCEQMVEKPKGDWTTNDATAFAKHCVFKSYDPEK